MIEKINKQALKNYYELERVEEIRLYDFTKPSCYYYDKKRMNLVIKIVSNEATFGSLLLDVGCGDASILRRINIKYAVGLDISKAKLHHARKRIQSNNYDFIEADAAFLPFRDTCFPIVLCSELIEHVPVPFKVLREIARVCKLKTIISTPTQTSLFRLLLYRLRNRKKFGPTHIREFFQEELMQLLKENHLYVSYLRATPILEFPFIGFFLKSLNCAKLLSKLDYLIDKLIPPLRRYGVFTCVVALKEN